MNLKKYFQKEYFDFYEKICYFLDNKDCIIFGGLAKSVLINSDWNKEMDVLCYDYHKTLKNFVQNFPPDHIEDIEVHTILSYKEYKVDICDMFETNDFSFNSLGLMGENIVVIPNIFTENIHQLIYQFNTKIGIGSRHYKNHCNCDRKSKYKDWQILY